MKFSRSGGDRALERHLAALAAHPDTPPEQLLKHASTFPEEVLGNTAMTLIALGDPSKWRQIVCVAQEAVAHRDMQAALKPASSMALRAFAADGTARAMAHIVATWPALAAYAGRVATAAHLLVTKSVKSGFVARATLAADVIVSAGEQPGGSPVLRLAGRVGVGALGFTSRAAAQDVARYSLALVSEQHPPHQRDAARVAEIERQTKVLTQASIAHPRRPPVRGAGRVDQLELPLE